MSLRIWFPYMPKGTITPGDRAVHTIGINWKGFSVISKPLVHFITNARVYSLVAINMMTTFVTMNRVYSALSELNIFAVFAESKDLSFTTKARVYSITT